MVIKIANNGLAVSSCNEKVSNIKISIIFYYNFEGLGFVFIFQDDVLGNVMRFLSPETMLVV